MIKPAQCPASLYPIGSGEGGNGGGSKGGVSASGTFLRQHAIEQNETHDAADVHQHKRQHERGEEHDHD
jgi:hypothetical protein